MTERTYNYLKRSVIKYKNTDEMLQTRLLAKQNLSPH